MLLFSQPQDEIHNDDQHYNICISKEGFDIPHKEYRSPLYHGHLAVATNLLS